ncbi:MAG TPA: LLM class flavin-dependent oxidoreductase [Acidimicrobiia bacterium]|nr:LLM class flavin-dependent oxidoreductase [Acidimicrobiia bacterium]
MELGLFVEPQVGGSYRRLADLARWAEAHGVDAFARSDHYLNSDESAHATDALVSLAAVAAETTSIRLVTLVSPITFRHPAVMAKSATTLDEISSGRFTLGVGTGWMEAEHSAFGLDLPPLAERFDRLSEALAYIRAVFDGGGRLEGRYYPFDLEDVAPAASPGLGIVVGGGGPKKTPTLAGTHADEYNMFVTDPDTLAARLEVMRGAAAEAGRNADDILVSFAGPALVFATESDYRAALAERASRRDMTPEEYSSLLTERFVPHGLPDQARQAIARMADAGIGRYYIQEYRHLDDIDLDALDVAFDALSSP